jgi:hypothetical protein
MKSLVVKVGNFYGGYKTLMIHIFKQIRLAKILGMEMVWHPNDFYGWNNPHNTEDEIRQLIDTVDWDNILDVKKTVLDPAQINSIVNISDSVEQAIAKIEDSNYEYFMHDVREPLLHQINLSIKVAYEDMCKLRCNFNIPNCESYFETNKRKVLVHIRRGDLSILNLEKHESLKHVPFKYYIPYGTKLTNNVEDIKGRNYYTIEQYIKEISKLDDCEVVVVSNNYKVMEKDKMSRCCFIDLNDETVEEIEGEFNEYEFKSLRDMGIKVHLSDEPDSMMRSLKSYFDCDVFIQGKDASMFNICKIVQEKETIVLK